MLLFRECSRIVDAVSIIRQMRISRNRQVKNLLALSSLSKCRRSFNCCVVFSYSYAQHHHWKFFIYEITVQVLKSFYNRIAFMTSFSSRICLFFDCKRVFVKMFEVVMVVLLSIFGSSRSLPLLELFQRKLNILFLVLVFNQSSWGKTLIKLGLLCAISWSLQRS